MTSSRKPPREAFVWVWLPRQTAPVVAGRLRRQDDVLVFNYGRSYLDRDDAIALYAPELPLRPGLLSPLPGMNMPGCLRDASPDAWGRRVILHRMIGLVGKKADTDQLDEIAYLLESGSDRVGALDFQSSATVYEPRLSAGVPLEELLEAAERVEKGLHISPQLDQALHHGTSIGGARPKMFIDDEQGKWIAKFASTTDLHPVVQMEFVAMRLAGLCGLNAAPVSMTASGKKNVLLIKRFDRALSPTGWLRRAVVSALTILELDELMARYASYERLAELIRHRFSNSSATLRELFARMTFNILVGNTDDHARNHSAFWDGKLLSLTPAYDICPQGRSGNEASQAMLIHGRNRMSRLSICLDVASHFLLSEQEAVSLVEKQILTLGAHWQEICDQARLTSVARQLLWGRQFLNPYAFEDLQAERSILRKVATFQRQNVEHGRD